MGGATPVGSAGFEAPRRFRRRVRRLPIRRDMQAVLAAWGPRIPPGARPRASALAVVPTALDLLGLPPDPALPGRFCSASRPPSAPARREGLPGSWRGRIAAVAGGATPVGVRVSTPRGVRWRVRRPSIRRDMLAVLGGSAPFRRLAAGKRLGGSADRLWTCSAFPPTRRCPAARCSARRPSSAPARREGRPVAGDKGGGRGCRRRRDAGRERGLRGPAGVQAAGTTSRM